MWGDNTEMSVPDHSETESENGNIRRVTIYTDGACVGNPGPGGYGAVLLCENQRKEISGGYRNTTNNRMEILAAIVGLEALKDKCAVIIYSDSEYLVKAMSQGWARRWRAKGWKRGGSNKALNPDLWQRLLELCEKHEVDFGWVSGHSGVRENERCDRLAMAAALGSNLRVDEGYEAVVKVSWRG